MRYRLLLVAAVVLATACGGGARDPGEDGGADADAGDADGDSDAGGDSDADGDSDAWPDCGFSDWSTAFAWPWEDLSTTAFARLADQSFIGSPDVDLDPTGTGWRLTYDAQYGDGVGRVAVATASLADPTRWADGGVLFSPPDTLGSVFVDTPDLVDAGPAQRLYYFGYPGPETAIGGQIGLAVRREPELELSFPVDGPAVAHGDAASWSGNWVESPVVRQRDGAWMMWFGGADTSWRVGVGVATSPDGIHWELHPDNPVLRATDDPADAEHYLSGGVSVLRSPGDDRWLLFYACVSRPDYEEAAVLGLCLASSTDGLHWDRHPGNPVLPRDFFLALGDVQGGPLNPSAVIDRSDPNRPRFLVFYEHAASAFGLVTAPVCRGM